MAGSVGLLLCLAGLASGTEQGQLRGTKDNEGPDSQDSQDSWSGWSFMLPNPRLLVWDKIVQYPLNYSTGPANYTIFNGWLKVPLVHDSALMQFEMPPYVCLRVRGTAALQQPAKNGPLLTHCGGPGSGRDCALRNFDIDGRHRIISGFDLIAIDQRGVNSSKDPFETEAGWGKMKPCPFKQAGEAVKPFPAIYCDEVKRYIESPKKLLQLLASVDNAAYKTDFKSFVYPIWENGTIPFTGMAPMNESFVRWYYRLVKLEHSLCFEAERYKIKAPNGRTYNALQFAGTVDLAYDLDILRRAIGATKLSLHGSSYGTSVASVYASIFPQKTHRVVMDGVVDPTPDVSVRGESFAQGIEAVWNGLVRDCDRSLVRNLSATEVCPAAPMAATKAVKILQGKNKEIAGELLAVILHSILGKNTTLWAPMAMTLIEKFYSGKEKEGLSMLEKFVGKNYRSKNDTEQMDHFRLGIQSVVMGTDTAGRLNEEEFIRWWRRTKESHPIGVKWATGWMVAMSTWPAYARPVPPVGDAHLKVVVIGNLHDPNTAYRNAQQMKKAFPQGYLVTWQGYGHCLKVLKHGRAILNAYKESTENDELPVYDNAVATYACMHKILSYLDTGEGVRDGHTCLVSEALHLGSAALALDP